MDQFLAFECRYWNLGVDCDSILGLWELIICLQESILDLYEEKFGLLEPIFRPLGLVLVTEVRFSASGSPVWVPQD